MQCSVSFFFLETVELYLHQKGHQVPQQSLKRKPSSSACHAAWKVCSCKCTSQGESRARKGRQPGAKIAYGEHERGAAREWQATKPLRLTKEKSLAQLSRNRQTERGIPERASWVCKGNVKPGDKTCPEGRWLQRPSHSHLNPGFRRTLSYISKLDSCI